MATTNDETMVRWPDGTEATLGQVKAGEFDYMSDDYELVHFPGHTLFTAADFTNEEWERGGLARMVIDGGLGICKFCGAGEIELDNYPTCRDYNVALRAKRDLEERKRRGLYWIDLQDVLSGYRTDRPFIFIDHALDRLILRVDNPEKVVVLTTSKAIKEMLTESVERNPSGVEVMTTDMARMRGIPQKDVILLGATRLGSMRNKFYRMVKYHQSKFGHSVLCIDGELPQGLKAYAVAASFGLAQRIYGPYREWVEEYFVVTDAPGKGIWIGKPKPGAEVAIALKFMIMADDRFAGMQGLLDPAEYVQPTKGVYPK